MFTDAFARTNESISSSEDRRQSGEPIKMATQTIIPTLLTKSIASVEKDIEVRTEPSRFASESKTERNQDPTNFRKRIHSVSDFSSSPSTVDFSLERFPPSNSQSSFSRLQNLLNQFDSGLRPELALNQYFGSDPDDGTLLTSNSRINNRPNHDNTNTRIWSRPNNGMKSSFVDWKNLRGGRSPLEYNSFGSIQQALTNSVRNSLLSSNLDDLSSAASEGNVVNSESPTEVSITSEATQAPISSTSSDAAGLGTEETSTPTSISIITSIVDELFSANATPPEHTTIATTEESQVTTELPMKTTTQLNTENLTNEDLLLLEKSNITSSVVDELLNGTLCSDDVSDEFLEEIIEMTKGRLTSEVNNTDEASNVTLQLKQFLLQQREKNSTAISEEDEKSLKERRNEFLSSDAVRERLMLLRIFKAKKERESGGRAIQKHLRKVKGATKVYQRTDDVDLEGIGVRVSTAVKLRDILSRRHREKKIEVTTEVVPTTITPPPSLRSQIEKFMNRKNQKKAENSRPRYENVVKVNGFRVIKENNVKEDEEPESTTQLDEEMIFSQGTQASFSQDFIPDEVSIASFLPTVPPGDRKNFQLQPTISAPFSQETSRTLRQESTRNPPSGHVAIRKKVDHQISNKKANEALGFLEDLLVRQSPRDESSSLASKLKGKMNEKFLPTIAPAAVTQNFAINSITKARENEERTFTFIPTAAPEDVTMAAASQEFTTARDPLERPSYDYYDESTEPTIEYFYENENGRPTTVNPEPNQLNSLYIASRNLPHQNTDDLQSSLDITKSGGSEIVSVGDSVEAEIEAFLALQNENIDYSEDDDINHSHFGHQMTTPEPDLFVGGIFNPINTLPSQAHVIQNMHNQPSPTQVETAHHDVQHKRHEPISDRGRRNHHHVPQPIAISTNTNDPHDEGQIPHEEGQIPPSRAPLSQSAPISFRPPGVRHIVKPPVNGADLRRAAPPSAVLRGTFLPPSTQPTPLQVTRHEHSQTPMRQMAGGSEDRDLQSEPRHISDTNRFQQDFNHHRAIQLEGNFHSQSQIHPQINSNRNNLPSQQPTLFQRSNIFPLVPAQNQKLNSVNQLSPETAHRHRVAHTNNEFQRFKPRFSTHDPGQHDSGVEIFDGSHSQRFVSSVNDQTSLDFTDHFPIVNGKPSPRDEPLASISMNEHLLRQNFETRSEQALTKLPHNGVSSEQRQNSRNSLATTFRPTINFGLMKDPQPETVLRPSTMLQITPLPQSSFDTNTFGDRTRESFTGPDMRTNFALFQAPTPGTPHATLRSAGNIHVRQHGNVLNPLLTTALPLAKLAKDASRHHQDDETNSLIDDVTHSIIRNHDPENIFNTLKDKTKAKEVINSELSFNSKQQNQDAIKSINDAWHLQNTPQNIVFSNHKLNTPRPPEQTVDHHTLINTFHKNPSRPPLSNHTSIQTLGRSSLHDKGVRLDQHKLIQVHADAPRLESHQPSSRHSATPLTPVALPEVLQTPAQFQESITHHDSSLLLATPKPGFLLPLSNTGNQVTEVSQLMDQGEVPGTIWLDYPAFTQLPSFLNFNCTQHVRLDQDKAHLFPDIDTRCQAYHLCQGGTRTSFMCPIGTIFNQVTQVCQWWFQVQCRQPFSAG
ncbi:uncharacterized protein LOC108678179 isoform X2 [Hyalella azteca]|uniref:Uncharacterized protein LOC108678179 isoform X2 n=1 Tax=Hyalella azteca TaxID=294128 RepID=A0A8B7PA13_HYAAZ|nr:uncharacterized protein LOC108678179 isoform X2 [Hyalella azteca]